MPNDEEAALTGPTDAVGPWTLKAIATQTRLAVVHAAQRENLTVSQWLERRVREWTEAGSPVTVQPSQPDTDAKLALVERSITAAVALAGAKHIPRDFRRRANQLLRESLPEPRALAAPQPETQP